MRLQHTSVVRMLPYANDKCTGCQTMGQLCKEFFHQQQQQKKLQPLNKFSNNSLLDWTMFTCRTGTKFAYGKRDPTAHPGSSAGGWKGGSLGGWPRRHCVWELLPLNPKSVANVFPRVWKDGWVQFMLGWVSVCPRLGRVAHGPWSHHSPLNNTILPPKIKSVFM